MRGGYIGSGLGSPLFTSSLLTFSYAGAGALVFDGVAPSNVAVSYSPDGGLLLSGEATIATKSALASVTGAGGMTFSGNAWIGRSEESTIWSIQ